MAPASGPLPTGLILDSATGVISGTPTVAGTFNFTVRVTDANGVFDDQALTIVVNPLPVVQTTSLPDATITGAYSQSLVATGGTLPLSWSLVPLSGALPDGLTLSTDGTISGTPTAVGTFNFTVRVTDAYGIFDDQALAIVVNPAPVIQTTSLPDGTVTGPYSETLTASGGTSPLTWGLAPASGPMPDGLTLDSATGVISGTPIVAGTFNFTVRVTDVNGVFGDQLLAIVVNAAPTVVTTVLPDATVTGAYSQALAATGGTLPLTWSLAPLLPAHCRTD